MQNNHACILHALDMTCMYKTSLYVHAPFVPVQVVAACTQSMETGRFAVHTVCGRCHRKCQGLRAN